MANQGGEFISVLGIHVRIDIGIDISFSERPKTTKFGVQIHLEELTEMRLIKYVLVVFFPRSCNFYKRCYERLFYAKKLLLVRTMISNFGQKIIKSLEPLPSGTLTHKVTWLFDHMVLRICVINQKHFTSTIRVAISINICSMLTYLDALLLIISHNTLITWLFRIMWQIKKPLYLHYHSAYVHQIWQDGDVPWGSP